MNDIVIETIKVKTLMQLYHWNTNSYSRHIASGKFYDEINIKLDQLVETNKSKLKVGNYIKLENLSNKKALKLLNDYKDLLIKNYNKIKKSDILNLIDEILSLTNQTIYLFSLR